MQSRVSNLGELYECICTKKRYRPIGLLKSIQSLEKACSLKHCDEPQMYTILYRGLNTGYIALASKTHSARRMVSDSSLSDSRPTNASPRGFGSAMYPPGVSNLDCHRSHLQMGSLSSVGARIAKRGCYPRLRHPNSQVCKPARQEEEHGVLIRALTQAHTARRTWNINPCSYCRLKTGSL